jgi:hypothetical protein
MASRSKGPARRRSAPADPGRAALEQLAGALGRDHGSGALPIVAVGEQEAPELLDAIDACRHTRAVLERRGRWHGEWAELDPARLGHGPWSAGLAPGTEPGRWHAARPLVLRGLLAHDLADHASDIADAARVHEQLTEGDALAEWIAERLGPEPEPFEIVPRAAARFDPARDLERVRLVSHPPSGRGKRFKDLWVKSSWLSDFDGEDSLRVRVSFGREQLDDASADGARHRRVHELAARLFPESALLHENPELAELLERCTGTRVLFTQHIAYWNAPGGGALFHHDAFGADDEAENGPGQLGVCYAQLSGRTAWLALSTQDLALRVHEFGTALREEPELAWLHAQLFPRAQDVAAFEKLLGDERALCDEIALPGCGRVGALVQRGPEFTAYLADAGHAALLGPGDVILLPNHGLSRTAMHSVFCASDERAYSLSLALRADETPPAR